VGDFDSRARLLADAVERIRHRHALGVEAERGLHIDVPDRIVAALMDVQGRHGGQGELHRCGSSGRRSPRDGYALPNKASQRR